MKTIRLDGFVCSSLAASPPLGAIRIKCRSFLKCRSLVGTKDSVNGSSMNDTRDDIKPSFRIACLPVAVVVLLLLQ